MIPGAASIANQTAHYPKTRSLGRAYWRTAAPKFHEMSCFIHIHKVKRGIYEMPAEVIFMDTTNGQSMGLWAANENIASLEEQLKSPVDKATREALERLLAIETEWLRLSQKN